jgi:hypothetical protein
VLTPRPDKYRGARGYAQIAVNAGTAGGMILRPPASGALMTHAGAGGGGGTLAMYMGPESGLPAFTPGLAVTSVNVHPTWGPDYAPTGVLVGGQFASVLSDGWGFATVYGFSEFEVFPPNVVALVSGILATAASFAIEWREFPSAEELQSWPSSRA